MWGGWGRDKIAQNINPSVRNTKVLNIHSHFHKFISIRIDLALYINKIINDISEPFFITKYHSLLENNMGAITT